MPDAGGETAADDWLNILELLNMYQKHLSDDELKTLLKPGPDTVQQTDVQWAELVEDVRQFMQRAEPTDSAEAQALAWRWMRLVIRMTRNDAALANKLMNMQMHETRALHAGANEGYNR